MKNTLKKYKFKSLRALDNLGLKTFEGEYADPCEHVAKPKLVDELRIKLEDEGIFTEEQILNILETTKAEAKVNARQADGEDEEGLACGGFTLHTQEELNEMMVQAMSMRPQEMNEDGALQEANVIVDICCVHCSPAETSGIKLGWISEDIMMSTVHGLNDAFRNKGAHYEEDGVDTFINFAPGNFRYLDGEAVWGANYKNEGINYDNQGTTPNSSTVIEYIKRNVMNSWQDPTRYLIVVYHRLHGGNSVAGYAWIGQRADSRLAGHFCKYTQMGDRNYLPEGQTSFQSAKTPIHEVGHSFSLFHTFNNTNACGVETQPTIQGDRVEDTPPHTQFDRCGTSIHELPSASHMSYAGGSYRRLFSQGQVDRMRATVAFGWSAFFNNPFYDWDAGTQPPVIRGCTDPDATNYNPEATEDDGTCVYPILGCTDPEATNYNPNATQDDGSCIYLNPPRLVKITQENPVSGNEIGNVNVQFQNTDTITIILTNKDGSVSNTHTVIKGEQPPVDPNLVASFKAENFGAEGWVDSISGRTANGSGELVTDEDGTGVRFKRDGSHFVDFTGLSLQDYSYNIVCKAEGVMDNIRSIFSKRVQHANNESWAFLFTWNGNTLNWDNTTNANRIDTGYTLPIGEKVELVLSREQGFFVNGVKVAEKGDPRLDVVNDEILRIGADYVTEGRGFGGIIYSFDIYNNSQGALTN